jgi:hypothetical protein
MMAVPRGASTEERSEIFRTDLVSGGLVVTPPCTVRSMKPDTRSLAESPVAAEDLAAFEDLAGEYHRLLRNLERFRDIGRTMLRVENEYSHDADRVIQVLFAAVRAGTPHLDIRHLRQMLFNSRDRFDSLSEEIATAEEGWTPDAEPPDPASEAAPLPVSDAESTTDTDLDRLDGDEEDSEGPGPEVRNYPRVEVSDAIQLAIDAFQSSRQDDLVRMLREARNRLGASIVGDRLRRECAQPSGEKLRSEVAAIVAWADEHRDLADSSE